MKSTFRLFRFSMCFFALAIALSGCALNQAKGPLFSTPASPPPGQALIYIYRPPTERHAYQRIYYVQANGIRLKNLKHGAYYTYETNPGHVKLIVGGKQDVWVGG